MHLRFFIFLLLINSHGILYSQSSPELEKILPQYKERVNEFLDEIKKVREVPANDRIIRAKNSLKPEEIFRSIRLFNKAWQTNAALLFYFHDGRDLNIFLLDEKTILHSRSIRVNPDSLLQSEINIRQSIGVYSRLSLDRGTDTRGIGLKPTVKEGDTTYLQKISSLLIDEKFAPEIEKYSHLLIVPTLNLYSFPFAALQPFKNNNYLGAVIPISILPNLYEFTNHRFSSALIPFRSGISNVTIVGGPLFNPYMTPQKYYGRNKTLDEFFLDELPFTIQQTNAVREMLLEDSTGKLRIGFLQQSNATLPNFLSTAWNADLIYIATHAFSSSRHAWDSGFIAFAGEAVPGKNFWSNRSVINSTFKAKLVVLSACQTGTGQLWEAGIISLGNSFYYAGADLVISTLWNVDDFYTFRYMREFMKGLLDEGTKHPAYYLHLIQKKTKFSPRHWAGFICFGI